MPSLRLQPNAPRVAGITDAASDFLGTTNLVLGGVVGVGGFAVAMRRQLQALRYDAWTYWTAVAMVAVFGTILADVLHDAMDLSYWGTSAVYALVVVGLFAGWYRSKGTLSMHSITTARRELFYWATVPATFAFGTAVGDLTGLTLHLGFLASGLLFTVAIAVPLVAWKTRRNPTVAFWSAYALTRPLSASYADWIGKQHRLGGGLGAGDGVLTLVMLAMIAGLVAYVARSGRDAQRPLLDGV